MIEERWDNCEFLVILIHFFKKGAKIPDQQRNTNNK
jgi:hypothetical protein